MRLLSLCVLLLSAGPLASVAHAQYPTPPDTVGTPVEGPILEPESSAEANHAEDPNRVPYETEKNVGVEVLRLPATLWRGFGDVVGLGVKWAEYSGTIDRLLNYAAPKGPAPIWGFAPVFSVGGRDGLVLGGRLFHRDLFGAGLRGRVGGRYAFGSTNTYSAHLGLAHPAPFGGPLALGLDGEFEQDGEERFYLVGNDTAEEERVPYERQYGRGALSAGLRLGGPFRLAGDVSYEYADVSPDEDFSELPAGDIAEALGTPGLGPFRQADLLEGGLGIALDLSRTGGLRAPRTYAGTVVILAYRYGTDLGSEPLAYHRIAADVRQYVPLPFLPRDRRLALRAYYEKVHPPDDHFVPFYKLAGLGGPATLRGYRSDRFLDEGALLLQMEYRYPIWDLLDAAVFADAGQVFKRYEDIAVDDFHGDVGVGLHVYGQQDVTGRAEVAFGPEGPRFLIEVGAAF